MWTFIANWAFFGVAFGIFITIGWGALSMNPPAFKTAHVFFSLAALIFLMRLIYWVAIERPISLSYVQLGLSIFIIFETVGCLWAIVINWTSERERRWLEMQSISRGLSPEFIKAAAEFREIFNETMVDIEENVDSYTDIPPNIIAKKLEEARPRHSLAVKNLSGFLSPEVQLRLDVAWKEHCDCLENYEYTRLDLSRTRVECKALVAKHLTKLLAFAEGVN